MPEADHPHDDPTPSSAARARSIGEVLEELVGEFPDITVSKIRFLETQGLIAPARTAAGYRQFSEEDVALLRWILLQQREHYLPLKVIRRRLKEGDGPGAEDRTSPLPEAGAGPPSGGEPAGTESPPAAWYLEDTEPGPGLEPAPEPVAGSSFPTPEEIDPWAGSAGRRTWSSAELAKAAGLDEAAVGELASFGLLAAEDGRFGEDSLAAARAAAGFFRYGVEPRHLRMYKTFAEREAALFEQVVLPMAAAREEGRPRAREALAELAELGQALRLSMLRAALGSLAGE